MFDWKTKLASRKLWAAVSAFASELLYLFGMAQSTVERIAALIMAGGTMIAYIIAEGLVDAKAASTPVVAEDVATIKGDGQ